MAKPLTMRTRCISLRHNFVHNPPDIQLMKSELPNDILTYQSRSTSDSHARTLGFLIEQTIAKDNHFKDIVDKSEVENDLVRAQKAIFNLSLDWKRFLALSPTEDDDREKENFVARLTRRVN
ncbi:MAG: hypothetical protein M1839_003007 [Geoglossum umbratile]|nr:MAG: hypothetical protein M1839_003007 [Geoglossum umbratile]